MDAFEIIRKTMDEFADVPDDTVQTFISVQTRTLFLTKLKGLQAAYQPL